MSQPANDLHVQPATTTEGLDDIFDVRELDASQGANLVHLDANRDELDASQDANWLSVDDAAERLGISIRAVQKRLKKGTLRGRKEKTPTGERWLIDGGELDASQGANIVRLDANQDELDASHEIASDKLVRDLQAKLEAASYRIGYLEAQLEAERQQIKLLTDSQHKKKWWHRVGSWFAGQ
jgi:hypothetical protein